MSETASNAPEWDAGGSRPTGAPAAAGRDGVRRTIRIFVINLDRRPERWTGVSSRLSALGLDFERMPAVDGEGLARSAGSDTDAITSGEIACHMSHRLCWQALAASEETHALILEDDVLLDDRLPRFLADRTLFPDEADIIRLETWCRPVEVRRRPVRVAEGLAVYRLARGDFGAAAYILHRDCAARLLATTRPDQAPVDNLLFGPQQPTARMLASYQVIPGLCVQGHVVFGQRKEGVFASDLETARRVRFDKAKVKLRPLAKLLRELARVTQQTQSLAALMTRRLLLGIVARNVPFAGNAPSGFPGSAAPAAAPSEGME